MKLAFAAIPISAIPISAIALCAFALNAAEAKEDAAIPTFTVIEADAYIPATREVTQFEIVDSDTILLRAGINNWYAAELWGACGRSARFEQAITIDSPGGGRIDRFATLVVDGRRCAIRTLSRVERLPAPDPSESSGESASENAGAAAGEDGGQP